MRCHKCGGKVKTTDSRASGPDGIRRRKECVNPVCKERFTTYEMRCDDSVAVLARKKRVVVIDDDRFKALMRAQSILSDVGQMLQRGSDNGTG